FVNAHVDVQNRRQRERPADQQEPSLPVLRQTHPQPRQQQKAGQTQSCCQSKSEWSLPAEDERREVVEVHELVRRNFKHASAGGIEKAQEHSQIAQATLPADGHDRKGGQSAPSENSPQEDLPLPRAQQ